ASRATQARGGAVESVASDTAAACPGCWNPIGIIVRRRYWPHLTQRSLCLWQDGTGTDSDPDGAGTGRCTLILDHSNPAKGRCKGTQQPDEVAYIPKPRHGCRVLRRQEEAQPRARAQGGLENPHGRGLHRLASRGGSTTVTAVVAAGGKTGEKRHSDQPRR